MFRGEILMLKKQTNSGQSMTIQSVDSLDTKNGETMQEIREKSNSPQQQQLTSSKNGHISFSVASLLADTRPTRSQSPSLDNPPATSPQTHHSSDEDYDSNQEDSIVDVEDLNSSHQKHEESSVKDFVMHQRDRDFQSDGVVSQGPIRPTPFSALAAAVYQAAHPNWPHQGLMPTFGGPGPIFQGPTPFGVPNMNTGKHCFWFALLSAFYTDSVVINDTCSYKLRVLIVDFTPGNNGYFEHCKLHDAV